MEITLYIIWALWIFFNQFGDMFMIHMEGDSEYCDRMLWCEIDLTKKGNSLKQDGWSTHHSKAFFDSLKDADDSMPWYGKNLTKKAILYHSEVFFKDLVIVCPMKKGNSTEIKSIYHSEPFEQIQNLIRKWE